MSTVPRYFQTGANLVPVVLLFLLIVPSAGYAEGDPDTGPASRVCFRESTEPDCRWTVIFESAVMIRAADANVRPDRGSGLFTFNAGLMRDLGGRTAMGGSFYISGDDDGARLGFRYRYRYWLSDRTCLDLSPGILVWGDDNYQQPNMPGLVVSASFAANGLVAFDTHFELYRYNQQVWDPIISRVRDEDGTIRAFYIGVTGRSWGAFVPPILMLIAYAMTTEGDTY